MTPVERLVAAGIRPDCAAESVMWYQAQGDDYGLPKILGRGRSKKGGAGQWPDFLIIHTPLMADTTQ